MSLASSNLDLPVAQVNAQIGTLMRRDLGLGLLFVTGQVARVTTGDSGRVASFVLCDGEAELRADLAPSLRNPPPLQAGQTVRATAWLGFYYPESRFRLIVRDLEVLETPPGPPPTIGLAPAPVAPAAAPFVPDHLGAPAHPAAVTPIDATSVPELEHAVLPPWLEEIRKRQFGGAGAAAPGAAPFPPPASFAEQATLRVPRVRVEDAAPEAAVPAAPAPDGELQAWLNQLFDASENEDIELTRRESEVVAVRTGGGQDRFRALGAATVAKLQDIPAGTLPPPPPAAQELLTQPPALASASSRAAAFPASALQSRAPEPEPIEPPKQGPPLLFWVLVAAGILIILASIAVAVWTINGFPGL